MTSTPVKTFALDELVFAKVKGYPHWPAKITEVKAGKFYSVVFFGTREVGNIKNSEIWNYYAYKDRFINDKTLKNPQFLKGSVEIRQEAGEEDVPATPLDANATPKSKISPDASKKRKLSTSPLKVENTETPPKKSHSEPKTDTSRPPKRSLSETRVKSSSKLKEKHSPSPKLSSKKSHSGAHKPRSRSVEKSKSLSSPKSPRLTKAISDDTFADEISFSTKSAELYDNVWNCDGSTNFAKCFEIFEDLLEINYTKLILLRNSQCFSKIHRLQELPSALAVYEVGEFRTLQENIRKVRAKAAFLFKKCCKIFNFPSPQMYWEEYLKALADFNKIPERERLRLTSF